MPLQQRRLQARRRRHRAEECRQHRIGERTFGNHTDPMAIDGHRGTLRREQYRERLAHVHGGNLREEVRDVLGVKPARRLAVIVQTGTPRIPSAIDADVMLESDGQQLGLVGPQDRIGISVQTFKIKPGDIDMNAQNRIGTQPNAIEQQSLSADLQHVG